MVNAALSKRATGMMLTYALFARLGIAPATEAARDHGFSRTRSFDLSSAETLWYTWLRRAPCRPFTASNTFRMGLVQVSKLLELLPVAFYVLQCAEMLTAPVFLCRRYCVPGVRDLARTGEQGQVKSVFLFQIVSRWYRLPQPLRSCCHEARCVPGILLTNYIYPSLYGNATPCRMKRDPECKIYRLTPKCRPQVWK